MADRCHGGDDEASVTGGRVHSPSTRTLKQDSFNPALGMTNDAGKRLYHVAGKMRTLAECADVAWLMHQSLAVYP